LIIVTAVASTIASEPQNQQPVAPIIDELIIPSVLR